LGYVFEIDKDSVIPDKKLSIQKGAILPLGPARESWTFQVVKAVAKKFDISTTAPVETLREEDINMLLFGGEESIPLTISYGSYGSREYKVQFDGIFKMLEELNSRGGEDAGNVDDFRTQVVCPSCEGARLKQDSLHFKIDNKNIYELANMDLTNLQSWFTGIEERLSERQNTIASEVLKEIRTRIGFLLDVGLSYLSLNRSSKTLSGGEAQRIRLLAFTNATMSD